MKVTVRHTPGMTPIMIWDGRQRKVTVSTGSWINPQQTARQALELDAWESRERAKGLLRRAEMIDSALTQFPEVFP